MKKMLIGTIAVLLIGGIGTVEGIRYKNIRNNKIEVATKVLKNKGIKSEGLDLVDYYDLLDQYGYVHSLIKNPFQGSVAYNVEKHAKQVIIIKGT